MCATSTNENVLFFVPPGPETPIGRYPASKKPAVIEAPPINDPLGIDAANAMIPIPSDGGFISASL